MTAPLFKTRKDKEPTKSIRVLAITPRLQAIIFQGTVRYRGKVKNSFGTRLHQK
jgi:hypothetical protein